MKKPIEAFSQPGSHSEAELDSILRNKWGFGKPDSNVEIIEVFTERTPCAPNCLNILNDWVAKNGGKSFKVWSLIEHGKTAGDLVEAYRGWTYYWASCAWKLSYRTMKLPVNAYDNVRSI